MPQYLALGLILQADPPSAPFKVLLLFHGFTFQKLGTNLARLLDQELVQGGEMSGAGGRSLRVL